MTKIKKILIAEDELPMSRALDNKLTKEGFDIVVVGNGEEAIKALSKEKFDIPKDVKANYQNIVKKLNDEEVKWNQLFEQYFRTEPGYSLKLYRP